MSRRDFLKASALFGAGALAGEVILPATASAQQASDQYGASAFCPGLRAGKR